MNQPNKPESEYDIVVIGSGAAGLTKAIVAPLAQGPFYAVKVLMGDLGTFDRLRTILQTRWHRACPPNPWNEGRPFHG